jgi:hypothetical protein
MVCIKVYDYMVIERKEHLTEIGLIVCKKLCNQLIKHSNTVA